MKIYKLNDLTDSVLQYDKNPPNLIYAIIASVVLLIVSIVALSFFTYKTEVVLSTGIITTDTTTNIQSSSQGKIVEMYKHNGDFVEYGDLLFEIDNVEVVSQITSLQAKVDLMEVYVLNYTNLINTLINIDFESDDSIDNNFEGEFYYTFNQFITYYESIEDEIDLETEEVTTTKESQRKSIIEQYISQYYQTKFQYEYEMIGNESQIEAYSKLLDNYKVYANSTGFINYLSNINVGSVIDSSIIGSISNELSLENSLIEVYVDVSSRSNIDVGYEVEMAVAGLSQSEYGVLKGEVYSISKDIYQTDDSIYYKIYIKPDSIFLEKENNKIILTVGQALEVRIKYDSISWFNWALVKLGVKDS